MSAPEFIDWNVLIYAYDETNSQKKDIAQKLVQRAFGGRMLVSTQALAEFAVTLLH